ncbi:MAG TPA: hypothetical protein PK639_02280 [Candidatus Woesebacteria bacterium]|nr:hypothetical protein [Candidatus Woesebacteria bacterium]
MIRLYYFICFFTIVFQLIFSIYYSNKIAIIDQYYKDLSSQYSKLNHELQNLLKESELLNQPKNTNLKPINATLKN